MKKFIEPEHSNTFSFYFKENDKWYKAEIWADDWIFNYVQMGREKTGYAYRRYLKPNLKHNVIGMVYNVEQDSYYENDYYSLNDYAEPIGGTKQIEFITDEHGNIDIYSVDFWSY